MAEEEFTPEDKVKVLLHNLLGFGKGRDHASTKDERDKMWKEDKEKVQGTFDEIEKILK